MGRFTAFREDVYPSNQSSAFPATGVFAMESAGALAWAAQLAYETGKPEKFDRILAKWKWQRGPVLEGSVFAKEPRFTLASGYAARVGQATVIAFAGTEPDSPSQWIENFAARPVDGIHEGFTAGVNAVWNEKEKKLQKVIDEAVEIHFCGHSLGGALAVATAHRLCREKPEAAAKVRSVHTMGMPRVGTEQFAHAYGSAPAAPQSSLAQRTFRLVHGEDLVSHVPPKFSPFGYRHVGRALRCPRGGRFAPGDLSTATIEGAGADAAVSLSDLVPTIFADPSVPRFPAADDEMADLAAKLPPIIRDHLMDLYLRALGAL